MADWMPPLRYWVLMVFVASALYAHFRGRVRFKIVRALTDFTVLLAPVNAVMYLFSRAPATPYLPTEQFKELNLLRENWQVIRDEALKLNDEGYIKAASGYTDIGFNSFFRTGWKRFYLKWYGVDMASAQALCPRTVELLGRIPTVKAAMFASLPPRCTPGAPPRPLRGLAALPPGPHHAQPSRVFHRGRW
jgi:beta-hydroxylase